MENAAARQPDGFARALRASQRQISQESPPAEDFSASANLRSFFHAIRSSSCSLLRPVSPQADRVYLCPVMGPGYFSTQKRFPVTWKHVTGKGITQIRRVEACPNRESQAPVLGMLFSGDAVNTFSRWENNRHARGDRPLLARIMRGGEKVLEALCQLFPEADIFTHVYDPGLESETIRRHKIVTTFINSLPRARRYYKHYLPLMPLALEQIDLRGYDLVISSESGPAKGIIPPAGVVHICYCHSPMRYVWNMFHDYREKAGWFRRLMMPPLCHYLRIWDSTASMRVDHFIANSATVAARIEKYYRRDAEVIYPPVNVELFESVPAGEVEDYYLMAGELVA